MKGSLTAGVWTSRSKSPRTANDRALRGLTLIGAIKEVSARPRQRLRLGNVIMQSNRRLFIWRTPSIC